MRQLFRFIALRHLTHKWLRAGLTGAGVALGVALYAAISIINQSTLDSFKANIEAVAGRAKLTVSAGEAGMPEAQLEKIQATPGVSRAVPLIEARAYLDSAGGSSETLTLLGVDLLKEQAVRTYQTSDEELIEDPLSFLNQPDSLILTRSFATRHGYKIGDPLELATAIGKKRFVIRGLLNPVGPAQAYGGALGILDIDAARLAFGKEGKIDRADLIVDEGAAAPSIDQITASLERALGPGYEVSRPEAQSEQVQRMVQSFQVMLAFFSGLALLVGLFVVANTVSISVAERRKEIGILRSLGALRGGILFLFLAESALVGIAGSAAGVGLGKLLARLLVGRVSQSMSAQYLTEVRIHELSLAPRQALIAFAIGVITALLAAAWPAFKASRISPLEALKHQEIRDEAPASRAGSFFSRHRAPLVGSALVFFVLCVSFLGWGLVFKPIETLGQFSSLLGAALLGPWIILKVLHALHEKKCFGSGAVARLTLGQLLKNRKRSSSTTGSLMVGLVLVALIATINASFRTTILDWFDRIFKAELLVSSNGKLITFQAQPLHENLARDLARVEGVWANPDASVAPVPGMRFLHIPYQGKRLGLKAYDAPMRQHPYIQFDLKDREFPQALTDLFNEAEPTILVSENFVLHFGKKTGDILELETPQGVLRARIAGVMVDFASSEGVLYMDRKLYRKWWNDPLVNGFFVQVKNGFDAGAVRARIDSLYGRSKNLTVLSQSEFRNEMTQTIDQSFSYTRAVELCSLLVALLGMLNTLLIGILERKRELGVLRAVGMSRPQLFAMVVSEAFLQGTTGAMAAVFFGGIYAYLWIRNSLAYVLGWMVEFHFPWSVALLTLASGAAVSLLAALLPGAKAAGFNIREALEYE